ncbi:MAG TPA: acetate--CoA ligase family protein, partial [Bacteroidales bacterium]|nr:acetate--CoA ligase family protein [Bacteroidales bacterium]
LTSIINVKKEIEYFISLGHVNFPEEVVFGNALTKVYNTPPPAAPPTILKIDIDRIREVIDRASAGYLLPQAVQELLDASGIPRAKEIVAQNMDEALKAAQIIGFPLVMKVIGPIHKTDVGGVALNISDIEHVKENFVKLISIEDAVGVLFQPMLYGTELFIGANWEPKFGHLILCGIGGVLIETLKDFSTALAPLNHDEAVSMILNLKTYSLFKGVRGQEGINESIFTNILLRVSSLLQAAPEIREMDLNPLLGNSKSITTVDARIRIEK